MGYKVNCEPLLCLDDDDDEGAQLPFAVVVGNHNSWL